MTERARTAKNRTRPGLHVREWGTGEPLVLVHGLASSSRYWGNPPLLAGQYRVLAPDLLGFGRSPKPRTARYTPAQHLAALQRALRQRLDGPYALLGHSLGSLLALHLAAAEPDRVRALILVSLPVVGSCAWGHGVDGEMNRWHRLTVHGPGAGAFEVGMRLAAPVWARLGPRFRPDVPVEATHDALTGTWASYWRSLEAVVYGTDVPALLARVTAPVAIIHGPGDSVAPVEPVRLLASAYPGVTLTEIAGAGHNPYFTHPHATRAAIAGALARAGMVQT